MVLCTEIVNVIKSPVTYLDVALPTALPKVLTYRWQGEENPPSVGMRVVVPLGNRRLTGVVWHTHNNKPKAYLPRDVEAIVDDRPVVTKAQTDCWSWMAQYYMCPLGEVVNAAMPSGMKLMSKTRILLNPDLDQASADGLIDSAMLLLDALKARKGMDLKEISEVLNIKYPQRIVSMLIDKGIAISEEELKDKYKVKKKAFVSLDEEVRGDDEVLKAVLDAAEKKAPARARALLKYLEMVPDGEAVDKIELQKKADVSSAVIKKLVDMKVFSIEMRSMERVEAFKGETSPLPVLSEAQTTAYNAIRQSLVRRVPALLNGVTGSGKTEIYVHLISEAIKAGQQVLFLVPEIALTTQLISRLQRFFSSKVTVYHSRFNASQRTETWLKVLDDKGGSLVVGPRSAMFMPFTNLGLIIVDEEHEPSYKQQDPAPRYHARDVVLWMAHKGGIPCVLGSATPSVETVWASEKGRITKVDLTKRYSGVMLPEVMVADLKKRTQAKKHEGRFLKASSRQDGDGT